MSAPLVSVIVPSYNRAYCLARTVDSALNQTKGNVEVIIVDDGSTDDTQGLVRETYGKEPRVRYHRQANAGISGARNSGLQLAVGDYLALLDSDDIWLPWKLELQLACMQAHPDLGMTWTNMMAVDPDDNVTDDSYLHRMYGAYRWYPEPGMLFKEAEPLETLCPGVAPVGAGRKFYYGDISSQMLMGNLVHTSTVIMTRDCAREIKTFREDLRRAGEDYEFHLRTCWRGPVGYVDISSIRYQCGRPDRATKASNGIALAKNFLAVIKPIIETEGEKVKLPLSMQNAVMAEAHLWYGQTLLESGDHVGARREIIRSLARVPRQPRAAGMLMMACLPRSLSVAARSVYRAVRRARTPASP